MSGLLPNGKQQFIDINGNPLVNGKVYFYIPTTTTPKDTWQNKELTILNTNPVVLNSRGQAVIWGDGYYRQQVYDEDDNLIWDQETGDPLAQVTPFMQTVLEDADNALEAANLLEVVSFGSPQSLSGPEQEQARDNISAAPNDPQYVVLASDSELPNARTLTAGNNISLVDAGAGSTLTISSGTQQTRQTVLGGPIDSSGFANFLPASGSGLSLTSQNISSSAPFVATAANGYSLAGGVNRTGQSTSNITWSGLTNSTTNYLFVDVNADGTLTPGATTLAPSYQLGGSGSTSSGQFTFVIGSYIGYVGNGSAAVQTYRVFVGEAVTSGGNVASTVNYAYRGRYISALTALQAANPTSFAHNIGTTLIEGTMWIECITNDGTYTVGQRIRVFALPVSATTLDPIAITNRNTITTTPGNSATEWIAITQAANSPGASPTNANWNQQIIAQRCW